jgi:hypothetical protein
VLPPHLNCGRLDIDVKQNLYRVDCPDVNKKNMAGVGRKMVHLLMEHGHMDKCTRVFFMNAALHQTL